MGGSGSWELPGFTERGGRNDQEEGESMKNKAGQDGDDRAGERRDNRGRAGESTGGGGEIEMGADLGRDTGTARDISTARDIGIDTGVDMEMEIRFQSRQKTPAPIETAGRLAEIASEVIECSDPGEAQRRRIRKLRQAAEELCGGDFTGEGIDRLPPDMEEAFWQQIIAYETAEPCNLFELVTNNGISLPEAVLVSEEHLSDRLWEVIYFLSSQGCYIENTDHLSDRELYALLRDKLLHEPAIIFPDDPNYAFHLDTIGSGTPEDQQIYLTYYATGPDRELWAKSWPEDPLPPRIPCPYDRDRLLPRPYPRRSEQFM